MSSEKRMDGCENSNEIDSFDIVEASIESCEILRQWQNYMWCDISRLRICFEKLGMADYIQIVDRLDDAVPVLVETAVYAFSSYVAHEPMTNPVIEDGLKDKPSAFVDYFEKLKKSGVNPPFFQARPDCCDPDVN